MTERMCDNVVGHHPTMPSFGEAAKAIHSTRRLEDGLHAFIMTIVLCLLQGDRGAIASLVICSTHGIVKWDSNPL